MKKILVINPNSSEKMAEDIRKTVRYAESEALYIDVVRMENAPHVLESFADYTMAGAEVLRYLERLKAEGPFPYDGVLLACMGDPCLFSIKEACPVPVVGVAEAAISTALLLGYKFSIVAASEKAKPMMDAMVMSYGLLGRMASVETLSLPIEAFLNDPDALRSGIMRVEKRAAAAGAEVLLLGCAGMTMLSGELETLSALPVVDPIKAGVEQLLALLRGGFSISRAGLYA